MARTIEDIRKATAEARARAASVLSPEQAALAEALAEEEEAKAVLAAEHAKVRALDMATRLEVAEAKAGTGYLVTGVDLVALFPPGKSPPAAQLPGGGVVIIRDPAPAHHDELNREVEAKRKSFASILIKLACDCLVDPDPDSTGGVTAFECFKRYQNVGEAVGQKARELGGARATQAKRGRE